MRVLLAFILWHSMACCLRADSQDIRHLEADVLIVGGTESGCAAAVQAARMGARHIILVNDIDWLGGQFSAEALVAIDENRGPAGYDHTVPFPRSGLFADVVSKIESLNKQKYGQARPGNTRVITTCRPSDAASVFERLLAPYIRSGQLQIVRGYYPHLAHVEKDRLRGLAFRPADKRRAPFKVTATVTIDATDWGDVIKLAGAAYEFGPDLRSKYGEPLAPTSRQDYPLTDMNPITYCMVINETAEYAPIARPVGYDPENYRKHRWPKDPASLYASRRVIDHYRFDNIKHPDVLLLCFPAFDYPLDVYPRGLAKALEADQAGASKKNIVQMSRRQRQLVFEDAKRYSLGFLYYLQTEVHDGMKDKKHSFRRFRLSDEFKTADRLPPKPYVRESLRLKAMYMMRQQDTTGYRRNARNYALSMYHDGVACWQFEYDFHPTKRIFLNKEKGQAGPWICDFRDGRTWGPPYAGKSLFPLRSLIPERVDGLLGCQKNLGYSSLVSSAVRLHDQSMAIGTAAGGLAAMAAKGVNVRRVAYERHLLSQLHEALCYRYGQSAPHALWPFADLSPQDPAYVAANLLAIRGALPLVPTETRFRPEQPATEKWRADVVRLTWQSKLPGDAAPPVPRDEMTRGQFVVRWWKLVQPLRDRPFTRKTPLDADGDGIVDAQDALLFSTRASTWPEYKPRPHEDGHPDVNADKDSRAFNFTGQGSRPVKGFTNDFGLPFSSTRKRGWSRDISKNQRRRNQAKGEYRDTFLFTRTHDKWEVSVPQGSYMVEVCVGDSGHEQFGQNVRVEGKPVITNQTTQTGVWMERRTRVEVRDGRLTVEIGSPGGTTNTCLNWVRISPVRTQRESPGK